MLPTKRGNLITLNVITVHLRSFTLDLFGKHYLANTYQNPNTISAAAIRNPQVGIINCIIIPMPIKKQISPTRRFFINISPPPAIAKSMRNSSWPSRKCERSYAFLATDGTDFELFRCVIFYVQLMQNVRHLWYTSLW